LSRDFRRRQLRGGGGGGGCRYLGGERAEGDGGDVLGVVVGVGAVASVVNTHPRLPRVFSEWRRSARTPRTAAAACTTVTSRPTWSRLVESPVIPPPLERAPGICAMLLASLPVYDEGDARAIRSAPVSPQNSPPGGGHRYVSAQSYRGWCGEWYVVRSMLSYYPYT
jgi:hypothetical protein